VASRRPAFRLTAPVPREHPLQVQIAKALSMEIAPAGKVSDAGVVWYSIDHANFAGKVPGVRLGRGVIAGILDTFVLHRGRAHLIEIKAPDGELSDAQQSVIAAAILAGARVGVCRDAFEVLACLDEWNVPRKRLIREAA
jgi:hypothetical protein